MIPWMVSSMPFVILSILSSSHECLQTSINELSKAKIQDQKHFENIALAVIKDVHRATSDLRKKIDCSPRLKKAINPSFFADIKNKVKLTEYPIEERPLLLIDPISQTSKCYSRLWRNRKSHYSLCFYSIK